MQHRKTKYIFIVLIEQDRAPLEFLDTISNYAAQIAHTHKSIIIYKKKVFMTLKRDISLRHKNSTELVNRLKQKRINHDKENQIPNELRSGRF